MVEVLLYAVLGAVVAGGVAGIVTGIAIGWFRTEYDSKRVDGLEARMNRMQLASVSAKGVEARAANSADEQEAMAEGMAIMQNPKLDQGAKMQQLLAIGMKHPKLLAKYMKELM